MVKPPITWVGNKERYAACIISIFPPKLDQYGEPFSGSAAVLLALPPDPNRLDIYNDLDADLVNFFSCVKECTNVLMRELKFLPIQSRATFEYYRDFLMHKDVYYQNVAEEIKCLGDRSCFTEEQERELRPIFDERLRLFNVKRAAAYYLAIRGSFSGTIKSYGVKGVDVERFLGRFPAVSRRLKNVPLENKNALQVYQGAGRVAACSTVSAPMSTRREFIGHPAVSVIRSASMFGSGRWCPAVQAMSCSRTTTAPSSESFIRTFTFCPFAAITRWRRKKARPLVSSSSPIMIPNRIWRARQRSLTSRQTIWS